MSFLSDLIGGKQKVTPTSSSSSYGTTRSSGASTSSSLSSSFGRSRSEVFAPEFFSQLFGNASGAAARAASAIPGLQGQAASLFEAGTGFLGMLEGPTATEDRLADTGVEDEQIAALGSDLGRFFSEEVNPRIGSRGIAAGQYGGTRGQVAQGSAIRALADEFSQGATGIRAAGVARRDALAQATDQTRTARAGTGIAALPGLLGLADAGVSAELGPYLQLAQIMGGPTVLSSSEAGSQSSALARAVEEAFGESRSSSSGSTITKGPGLLDVGNMLAGFV